MDLFQVEQKMKELESLKSDMDGVLSSLVPKIMSDKLKEGQTVIPETLEQASVMALRIRNFTELSTTLRPVVMVKLLNALNDAIDNLILEQDVERMTSLPGTFLLMSGLRHKHARQHAVTLTLVTLDICAQCRLMCNPLSHSEISKDLMKENNKNLEKDTEKETKSSQDDSRNNSTIPNLVCCIATGPVSIGVTGSR